VNYSSRRTESSSEHFASDLSLLKADALWCENKWCLESNPWPMNPKVRVLLTTPWRPKVTEMDGLLESHTAFENKNKYTPSALTFHITTLAYFMPIAIQLVMQFGGMSALPIRKLNWSAVGLVRKHPWGCMKLFTSDPACTPTSTYHIQRKLDWLVGWLIDV